MTAEELIAKLQQLHPKTVLRDFEDGDPIISMWSSAEDSISFATEEQERRIPTDTPWKKV